MSSDSEIDHNSLDSDSDTELQNAFASKKLKPGLNIPVQVLKREKINNVEGMKQQLDQIKLKMDWLERLDLINDLAPMTPEIQAQLGGNDKTSDPEDTVNNDFKREINFYRQAQGAVLEALQKLHKENIPTKRPDDYLAEMVKSDDHMTKIRAKLLSKKMNMENSQKAKKLRELRKQGKKIQHEVLQQRLKDKKEMMEAVKKYRKGDQNSLDFLERSGKGKNIKFKPNAKSAAKRKFKEDKYGYGGKKKRSKYNTGNSSADMSGFSSRKHSKGSTSNKRLGKSRRHKMKNRK